MRRKAFTIGLLFSLTLTFTPGAAQTGAGELPWWNDRVFYEIFVRSFHDSDGDGIGDLQGLISKLDYLNDGDPTTTDDLGITGIWLMPVAQSPSYHGYDVMDYREIESDYGTNEDFRQLVAEAHRRGIAVIVDLVMNHTSSQHPWFVEAKNPDSAYRNWYIWVKDHPGYLGPWGQQVWYPLGDSFYYGLFWRGMPDLNYNYPPVTEAMYDIVRFWLEEMGADGFRLDAVRHLIEQGEQQADTPATLAWLVNYDDFIDTVNPDALTVGEVWTNSLVVSSYIKKDALDLAFEFDLADAMVQSAQSGMPSDVRLFQKQVSQLYPPGQYATFLTNHDQPRLMTQLAGDMGAAKVAAALLLTSPGVPFIYYGEEIGMTGDKPDECIRTPMQWDDSPPAAAFTLGLPCETLPPEAYASAHVAAQAGDPDSLLSHYRALIHLRNDHAALRRGDYLAVESNSRLVYGFARHLPGDGDETLLVVVNPSREPVRDYALSLAEGPLSGDVKATLLFGEGEISAPAVNTAGGFESYLPLPEMPARSAVIIQLGE